MGRQWLLVREIGRHLWSGFKTIWGTSEVIGGFFEKQLHRLTDIFECRSHSKCLQFRDCKHIQYYFLSQLQICSQFSCSHRPSNHTDTHIHDSLMNRSGSFEHVHRSYRSNFCNIHTGLGHRSIYHPEENTMLKPGVIN